MHTRHSSSCAFAARIQREREDKVCDVGNYNARILFRTGDNSLNSFGSYVASCGVRETMREIMGVYMCIERIRGEGSFVERKTQLEN